MACTVSPCWNAAPPTRILPSHSYGFTVSCHRPYLLLALAEGEDSYLRVLDFCAESIARRAGEQKVKGGSLQSTSGGAAGSVVEAPTRHNEKPHHENTIARPHQH